MGKFSSALCEKLYMMSLDGGPDEECGSVPENGEWHGLMVGVTVEEVGEELLLSSGLVTREELGGDYDPFLLHAILTEDSQGFINLETFDTEEGAQEVFAALREDLEPEETGPEDDVEPEEDSEDEQGEGD